MTKVALVMGNLEARYPNISSEKLERIENICTHLAAEISQLNDVVIIHGGRTSAISTKIVEKMPEKFIDDSVHTYLPKLDLDKSHSSAEYSEHGKVFEKGSYTEERRDYIVDDADIILFSDGNRGVRDIYSRAKVKNKRIIPIQFGVEDNNYLVNECATFQAKIKASGNINLNNDWLTCANIRSSEVDFARGIVRLLRAYLSGEIRQNIFLSLPLTTELKAQMEDIIHAVKEVSNEFGHNCFISIDDDGEKPIIDEIMDGMDASVILISILDGNRPNIYFETGYMKGRQKPVVMCCHVDHFENVAFDTKAYKIEVWGSLEELKRKLRARFSKLGITALPSTP